MTLDELLDNFCEDELERWELLKYFCELRIKALYQKASAH